MTAAPRVALLVHNRLEQDPRVSRHARAAREAGYRVAVLSVLPPQAREDGHVPRWGSSVEGVAVYESRVLGRTLLGRLRSGLGRLRQAVQARHTGARSTPEGVAAQPVDGAGSVPN